MKKKKKKIYCHTRPAQICCKSKVWRTIKHGNQNKNEKRFNIYKYKQLKMTYQLLDITGQQIIEYIVFYHKLRWWNCPWHSALYWPSMTVYKTTVDVIANQMTATMSAKNIDLNAESMVIFCRHPELRRYLHSWLDLFHSQWWKFDELGSYCTEKVTNLQAQTRSILYWSLPGQMGALCKRQRSKLMNHKLRTCENKVF